MGSKTSKLNLEKPFLPEKFNINTINDNMDIIDNSMTSLSEKIRIYKLSRCGGEDDYKLKLSYVSPESVEETIVQPLISDVASVNGYVGHVVLTPADIGAAPADILNGLNLKDGFELFKGHDSLKAEWESQAVVEYPYDPDDPNAIWSQIESAREQYVEDKIAEYMQRLCFVRIAEQTNGQLEVVKDVFPATEDGIMDGDYISKVSIDTNGKIVVTKSPLDKTLSLYSKRPVENQAITKIMNNKVDKISGKGLSTNDLTDELKAQYDIAEENVQSDWDVTDINSDAFIKNKPIIDTELSSTSTNAVQNKVIYEALQNVTGGILPDLSNTFELKGAAASALQTAKAYTDTRINSALSGVYRFKASVDDADHLPTTGMDIGDVFDLKDTGMNVAWNGSGWDELGMNLTISQPDWEQTDDTKPDFINNKPDLTVDTALSNTSEYPVQNKVIANAINTMTTNINNKVDKVNGKGLSTRDFTAGYESKLNGIESGAQKNVTPDWNATTGQPGYIANKPDVLTTVDDAMSDTSENPVQNKVVKSYIDAEAAKKVDAEYGKGLSEENFTTGMKNKLANIELGAEKNVQSDWEQTDSTKSDFIKNKPNIPDSVIIDAAISATSDHALQNKVIFEELDKKVDKVSGKQLSTEDFTTALKNKLNNWVVDSSLSSTSSNPVKNSVIKNALNNKVDKVSGKGLSTNDLTNELKAQYDQAQKNVQSDWNQTDASQDDYIRNKPNIPPSVVVDDKIVQNGKSPVEGGAIYNALELKVDKITGKGLSTNDLTNELKAQYDQAEKNVQSDWYESDPSSDAYIKNKPSIPTSNVTYLSHVAPINVNAHTGNITISHDLSSVIPNSYGDTGNQTPDFNDTFTVSSLTVDKTGHVTSVVDHTVQIPNRQFVQSGNSAAKGLVPAPPKIPGNTKYLREDGVWAEVVTDISVTGVKGSKEDNYRTGNVTLSADNIGAVAITEQSLSATQQETARTNIGIPFRFGIDGEGNYGYYKEGETVVTPFKSGSGSGDLTKQRVLTLCLLQNHDIDIGYDVVLGYDLTDVETVLQGDVD